MTTEPQCQELAKIIVYEDDAHQKEADDKSQKERLKLVKEILKKNDNKISTKLIVDAVREKMAEQNNISDDLPPVKRYEAAFGKTCDNIDKMMQNIMNKEDIATVKRMMKARLQKTLDFIDELKK